MRWAWYVAFIGEKKTAYKILIRKPEEKRAPEFRGIAERKIGPKNYDLNSECIGVMYLLHDCAL